MSNDLRSQIKTETSILLILAELVELRFYLHLFGLEILSGNNNLQCRHCLNFCSQENDSCQKEVSIDNYLAAKIKGTSRQEEYDNILSMKGSVN